MHDLFAATLIVITYLLIQKYLSAKATIINVLSKLWVEPSKLKSGESVCALMNAIRRAMWEPNAFDTATRSVKR